MLDIVIRSGGVVALIGRLDAAEADRTLRTLGALPGPLVIDCTELEYLSSAGLGVIVQTYKRLNGALSLAGVQPHIRNVFMYAGLLDLLNIT